MFPRAQSFTHQFSQEDFTSNLKEEVTSGLMIKILYHLSGKVIDFRSLLHPMKTFGGVVFCFFPLFRDFLLTLWCNYSIKDIILFHVAFVFFLSAFSKAFSEFSFTHPRKERSLLPSHPHDLLLFFATFSGRRRPASLNERGAPRAY